MSLAIALGRRRLAEWLTHLGLRSLAGRLYSMAVASGLAVTLVAAASVYYAFEASNSAQKLRSELTAHHSLSDLSGHVASHQTLVAVLAREPDEAKRRSEQAMLEATEERILTSAREAELGALAMRRIARLIEQGRDAARLTTGPASVESMRYQDYAAAADRSIREAQGERLGAVEAGVASISAGGARVSSTMAWILGLCLVFMMPGLLWAARSVIARINRITLTMQRIAQCETAVDVPSTIDADEVGDLARAVQIFKRNTIALLKNNVEIERLNGWFDLALDNMHRGLSIFDKDQRLVMSNDQYREIYDLPLELVRIGTPLATILEYWKAHTPGNGEVAQREINVEQVLESYRSLVAEGDQFVRVHTLSANRIIVVSYRPLADGGWMDVHEDVTDRVENEEKIRRLARIDTLTGLANRRYFLDSLGAQLGGLSKDSELAVVLLDLIGFRRINDTLGHRAGDDLLCEVARRLEKSISPRNCLARIGADGFAIVMPETGRDAATDNLALIDAALAAPYILADQDVAIVAGVGIAIAPRDGTTAAELMRRADIALDHAKQLGGGQHVVFEPGLENALRERQTLEMDLKVALDHGELELHYQPIVDFERRQVTSLEALMRWRHPVRGMVLPADFIPIAEEVGLIRQLGEWAIRRACQDALGWPPHVRVAVNLSAAQFDGSDLPRISASALQTTGLPAKRLEFEVTESLLLGDEAKTRQTLLQLKEMGVRIALDDFGTGYASLSYLRSFPFDKIKIDRTFVRDLPNHADCHAIVQSVVALAGMLGMRTVAEGIETQQHLEQVVAAGCDEVQGFYLSPPVPAADVAGVIARCEDKLAAAA